MAKRKATKRTRRKARGGYGLREGEITPAMPGITITYENSAGMPGSQTIYIGPPSSGGAGGSELGKDIGGSPSDVVEP